jgi:hypothetical protein
MLSQQEVNCLPEDGVLQDLNARRRRRAWAAEAIDDGGAPGQQRWRRARGLGVAASESL